ncbi:hypothetical protein PV08_08600 [Exophiala spinifera]|uniref:Uncharacterized protein n=1 Tax=Exophiala spinifera TaxID=91928 RepID=A0A0D1ZKQ4_9EURO|nr:uncharacterized protein PV08_08600 [Exophiala spinifera]KIW13412.1 hypothetical protein PV08_08600 [Exophiala spinifera]
MSLTRSPMSPLRSHNPLSFASQPDRQQPDMSRTTASRLNFVASWKLDSEAAREEPRLRNMLGHLSIFEGTRTIPRPGKVPAEDADPNELSAYIQQHVPSFQDFQTAIALQLATIAQIQAAAASVTVVEYNSDDDDEEEEEEEEEEDDYDDDDDDYDDYDGNWSDSDPAAESDDSSTDDAYETSDSQWSPCSSPTSSLGELEKDEEGDAGLWAIRPLAPIIKRHSEIVC